MSFIPNIDFGWLTGLYAGLGITGLIALAVLAVVFPAFGAVIGAIVEALKPILKVVGEAVATALKWVWENIIWKGLTDIFDSWPTVATVGIAAYILYLFMSLNTSLQVEAMRAQANSCKVEVAKLDKTAKSLSAALKKAQKQQPGLFGF
jgi:hypothetical protein